MLAMLNARSIETVLRSRLPEPAHFVRWSGVASVAAVLALAVACKGTAPDGSPAGSAPAVVDGAVRSGATSARSPELLVLDEAGEPAEGARVWLVDRARMRPDRAVIASRSLGDWVATTRAIAAQHQLADEDGRVRFEIEPSQGFLVAAELDELFGAAERIGPIEEAITLPLVPRQRYYVRVLDVTGAPAIGVPVTLGVRIGDETRRLPATAFTGAEGLATLYEPPAAAFLAADELAPSADDFGRVAIARIPSRSQPSVRAQTEGVATLVLPPTVPLTVRASHRGFDADHWTGLVQVFPAADGTRSEQTLAVELDAGVATIPHVEVGTDLRVIAVLGERDDAGSGRFAGTISQSLRGAKAMGERLEVGLVLDAGVLVTGRCLTADRAPLANQPVDVFIVGEPATGWTVVTEEDGGFRWLLPRLDRALVGARLGLRAQRYGAAETGRASLPLVGTGAAPGSPLERGSVVDLGDIVVE